MFDRLSRSWSLVKASAAVLRDDKELLVFPLLSSIAMLAVLAMFVVPMFATGAVDAIARHGEHGIGHYVVGFLFYVVEYFVAFFFNAALVGAAMIRLEGGNPTVKDGLSIASSKAWNILGYALIAATVGMIIRAIEERVGFLGRIIVGFIGAAWSLATFLVVPVLVARDVGPAEAVRESAEMLKKTWGENVIGQGGMGVAFFFIYAAIVGAGVSLIVVAAMANNGIAAGVAAGALVIALMIAALVHSALAAIYSAALFRYANGRASGDIFPATALQTAFAPK